MVSMLASVSRLYVVKRIYSKYRIFLSLYVVISWLRCVCGVGGRGSGLVAGRFIVKVTHTYTESRDALARERESTYYYRDSFYHKRTRYHMHTRRGVREGESVYAAQGRRWAR